MKAEVIEIEELSDGGAIVTFDMDAEMTSAMVKIGLLKVLTDAAEEATKLHSEANEP